MSRKHAEDNHTLPHGNRGFGRFSFIHFAVQAKWETIYQDKKTKKRYKYAVIIKGDKLNNFDPGKKEETNENVGTKVSFMFDATKSKALVTAKGKDILKNIDGQVIFHALKETYRQLF